jgi:hypothetical protein
LTVGNPHDRPGRGAALPLGVRTRPAIYLWNSVLAGTSQRPGEVADRRKMGRRGAIDDAPERPSFSVLRDVAAPDQFWSSQLIALFEAGFSITRGA